MSASAPRSSANAALKCLGLLQADLLDARLGLWRTRHCHDHHSILERSPDDVRVGLERNGEGALVGAERTLTNMMFLLIARFRFTTALGGDIQPAFGQLTVDVVR